MEMESFFQVNSRREPEEQKHHRLVLLSGPPSSGKTSLLFQFAINSALENAESFVLFIFSRRTSKNPPFLSQGIDPSSPVFQRIRIKYLDDDMGMNKFFAAFHLHSEFPCAVVVDDFADFFDQTRCKERHGNNLRGKELAMIRTLALCHNAIVHANERRRCKLVLSDTHNGDSPRSLFIYKRWISSIFTITADGCGSFILKSNDEENGTSNPRTKITKYSIALQYLNLESITTLDSSNS